jgi:preprotein translocase subunit YajC
MNAISSGLVLLQAPGGQAGQLLPTLFTMGLIFVIFYFFIIRPQNKKQKEAKAMVAAMKKGDRVVTIGGAHGVISSVKEATVIVKVDDTTKIEFSKSAIQAVTARSEDKGSEVEEKSAEEKK